MAEAKPSSANPLLERLFERLANRDGVHFKHQTRDEPDLTVSEKIEIARQVFEKSPGQFLSRFHQYLNDDDRVCFAAYEQDYEVTFYLKEIATRDDSKKQRNRRYVAMGRLMSEGHYFSESAMKERDPVLYDELIGRFIESGDTKHPTTHYNNFSEFLIACMDPRQTRQPRRIENQQDSEDSNIEEFDTDEEEGAEDEMAEKKEDCENGAEKDEEDVKEEMESDKTGSCTDEEDSMDDGEAEMDEDARQAIEESQKEMYRQEFLSVMQGRFLRGEDKDFDYEALNGDLSLDDMTEQDRDCEDRYFDDEEPEAACAMSSDGTPELLSENGSTNNLPIDNSVS